MTRLLLAAGLAASMAVLAGCAGSAVQADGAALATGSIKPARMAAGEGRVIVGHPSFGESVCNRITVERLGPAPAGVKSRHDISFGMFFASARITEVDLAAARYAVVEAHCQMGKNTTNIRASTSGASLAVFEVRAGEVADIGRLELYTFRSVDLNLGRPVLVVHQAGLETIAAASTFMPASAAMAVKRPMVPTTAVPPDIDVKACKVERDQQAKGIVLIPKEPYPCLLAKRKGLVVGSG